jgi:hypothetical protein
MLLVIQTCDVTIRWPNTDKLYDNLQTRDKSSYIFPLIDLIMNNEHCELFSLTIFVFAIFCAINAFPVPTVYSTPVGSGTGNETTGPDSPGGSTSQGGISSGTIGTIDTPAPSGSSDSTPAPSGSSDSTPAPSGSSDSTPAPSGSDNDGRTTILDSNNDGRTTILDSNNDGRTTILDNDKFGVTSHRINQGNNKNQENTDFDKAFASNQTSLQKVYTKNIVLQTPKLLTGEMTQIASLDPFHLIGMQVSMNLTNNRTQLVAAQVTERGIEHAVVINLTKVINIGKVHSVYQANFGSSLSGTNPFNGLPDMVDPITSLLIRNNDIRDIEFENDVLGNITFATDSLSTGK